MPRVASFEDVKSRQRVHRGSIHTPFLESTAATPRMPVAFLSQGEPRRVTATHYHLEDEFLLVVEGDGMVGRHAIGPYTVQFVRRFTPYGPIIGGSRSGIGFFVLSARFEEGAQYLPQTRDQLFAREDRQPWQIVRQVDFSAIERGATDVELQEIADFKNDEGLFACSLSMVPNAEADAPSAANGDGQFIVVVQGSVWHGGKEHRPYTVAFVEPHEAAFHLKAGSGGLQAIIMNFPQVVARAPEKAVQGATGGFKKWQCELCAFAYDEALGLPAEGIPAGTRWHDVPASWTCPDCAATKSDFAMVEVQ